MGKWNLYNLDLSAYGIATAAVNEALSVTLEDDPDSPLRGQQMTVERVRPLVLSNDFIHALGGPLLTRVFSRDEAERVSQKELLLRLDLNTLELAAEGTFDDDGLDAFYGKGTGRRVVLAEVERCFKGAKNTMMREMDEASIATAPRLRVVRRAIQAASELERPLDVSEIQTTRLILPFPLPPEDTNF